MKDKIIGIIEGYFDNYVGLREGHRALNLSYLPELAEEIETELIVILSKKIEAALIWHGPDEVPARIKYAVESACVLNQSSELVFFDFLDKHWVSADNPSREAQVEKWRYPAPVKIKQ